MLLAILLVHFHDNNNKTNQKDYKTFIPTSMILIFFLSLSRVPDKWIRQWLRATTMHFQCAQDHAAQTPLHGGFAASLCLTVICQRRWLKIWQRRNLPSAPAAAAAIALPPPLFLLEMLRSRSVQYRLEYRIDLSSHCVGFWSITSITTP